MQKYIDAVLSHFGANTTERKAKIRKLLTEHFGPDYIRDENSGTLADTVLMEALDVDTYGRIPIGTADQVESWIFDNLIDA